MKSSLILALHVSSSRLGAPAMQAASVLGRRRRSKGTFIVTGIFRTKDYWQMIREVIYGQILAKANHYQAVPDTANGGRRIILDEAYRAYQKSFIQQCHLYKDRGIDRPFLLFCHVWHSSKRFDLDNSLKSLLDLLQDVGAIKDDNLCIGIQAVKHLDPIRPRIEFALGELEPRLF